MPHERRKQLRAAFSGTRCSNRLMDVVVVHSFRHALITSVHGQFPLPTKDVSTHNMFTLHHST